MAAQVRQNKLSHYVEVSLCYITRALRGRIGHGNETVENSSARLSAKLKSHHFRTQPYPIKVAWITDLYSEFPLNLLSSVDITSHLL